MFNELFNLSVVVQKAIFICAHTCIPHAINSHYLLHTNNNILLQVCGLKLQVFQIIPPATRCGVAGCWSVQVHMH